jgi:hypothetical protein
MLDGKTAGWEHGTPRTSRLAIFLSSCLLFVFLWPVLMVRDSPPSGDAALPKLFLWAWERPDDLRGLPRGVGVAFLAQTITVSGVSHILSRRRQPLLVDDGTPMIAVTRIEAAGDVSHAPVGIMAREIADRARLPMVSAIQVDFDARESQRPMYRQLLYAVRASMPQGMPLSMTALASWCLDDDWIDELPVDEAVPMLFRMGPASAALRRDWSLRTPAPRCRGSLGVSLDEPGPWRRRARRTYVFNPNAWNSAAVRAAVEETP